MDNIIIEELEIFCVIGLLPHEREYPQKILLDVVLSIPQAEHDRTLDSSVDYHVVCVFLESYLQEKRYWKLEEACLASIAQIFAKWVCVQAIELTIRKTAAVPQAKTVGVRMKRVRG